MLGRDMGRDEIHMPYQDDRAEVPGDRSLGGASRPPRSSLPPLTIALLVITMLGGIGGYFFATQAAAPTTPAPLVDMVAPEDMADAITTLSPNAVPNTRSDNRGCRFPIGFMTVATPGNPAGGIVRFRTSKYQSPQFLVTDKPQRIAIPNPLPETGGVDLLSVDGDAKGLVAALTPTLRMEPINGTATVKVLWRPRQSCKS
jgi:hypothetical protein